MTETATTFADPKRVHAHRCEACAANGRETIWVHGDENRAKSDPACDSAIAAHKCPVCGQIQWKQFLVPVGQKPRAAAPQTQDVWSVVLLSLLFFTLTFLTVYLGWRVYSLTRGKPVA